MKYKQYTYHGWMIGEAFPTNEMFRMLEVIGVAEFTFKFAAGL